MRLRWETIFSGSSNAGTAEISGRNSGRLALFLLTGPSATQNFSDHKVPIADNSLQRTAKAARRTMRRTALSRNTRLVAAPIDGLGGIHSRRRIPRGGIDES